MALAGLRDSGIHKLMINQRHKGGFYDTFLQSLRWSWVQSFQRRDKRIVSSCYNLPLGISDHREWKRAGLRYILFHRVLKKTNSYVFTHFRFGAEIDDCGWTPNCRGSFQCLPKTRTPGRWTSSGSISVSGQLPTYPSPNPTLTLTCYQ